MKRLLETLAAFAVIVGLSYGLAYVGAPRIAQAQSVQVRQPNTSTVGTTPHLIWQTGTGLGDATQLTYNSGTGALSLGSALYLTAADVTNQTMTRERLAGPKEVLVSFLWTNAMVTALGGVTAGDIKVCTLPDKAAVKHAYVVVNGADTSSNALSVALGRTSASYIDWVVASSAKVQAFYGDDTAEQGTGLASGRVDVPSYGGAGTDVFCHFIKTTTNLNTVTGSSGRVIIEYSLLP